MQDKEGSDNQKGLKLPPNRDKGLNKNLNNGKLSRNFLGKALWNPKTLFRINSKSIKKYTMIKTTKGRVINHSLRLT